MIPQTVTIFPQYVIYSRVGLINNPLLWFLWGVASTPFQILLFRQFFAAFPKELEDAAEIGSVAFWDMLLFHCLINPRCVERLWRLRKTFR